MLRAPAAGSRRAALFAVIAIAFAAPAAAQNPPAPAKPILQLGDAVVTGFSGVTAMSSAARGKPEDSFTIDPEGSSLVVFDLSRMNGPDDARLVDAPRRFSVQAKQIGQVFGVTLDDGGGPRGGAPNIYATATSMFGLNIVAPSQGRTRRAKAGSPDAKWMAGQFGPRGGPGSIWRIDRSGRVSLFANVAYQGAPNSGAGLGNIAFDPVSKHLFVSDLETGMIHRFAPNRAEVGTYDHGTRGRPRARLSPVTFDPARRVGIDNPAFNVENPATWGYAAPARRVFGLAVQGGRLFYAVAEGPQIWSVGINANGSFADDARSEISITAPSRDDITDIIFSRDGTMYLSQRGPVVSSYDFTVMAKPKTAAVLVYRKRVAGNRETWEPAGQEYAIGFPAPDRNTNGGVALGYGYDQRGVIRNDACERMLWSTGELLRLNPQHAARLKPGGPEIVQGLQGNDIGTVRPANVPPFKSYFVDFDGQFTDAGFSGHMGDVDIWSNCGRQLAQGAPPPAPPGQPDIVLTKTCFGPASAERAHCRVTLGNRGAAAARAPIQFTDRAQPVVNGVPTNAVVPVFSVKPDQAGVTCSAVPANALTCTIPAALLQPGRSVSVDVVMDVSRLTATPGWRMRNCATLANRTECAETGGQLTLSKSGPERCFAGGTCTFKITLTNSSREVFDGKVAFADNMQIAAALKSFGARIESIRPALGCSPAPSALPFLCQAHLTLPPGGTRTFSITVRLSVSPMPPRPLPASNCFVAIDPFLVPANVSPGSKDWFGGILLRNEARRQGAACSPFLVSPAQVSQAPPPRQPRQPAPPRQPPKQPPKKVPHPAPPGGCPDGFYPDGKWCMPEIIDDCPGDTCEELPSDECPDGTYEDGGACFPFDPTDDPEIAEDPDEPPLDEPEGDPDEPYPDESPSDDPADDEPPWDPDDPPPEEDPYDEQPDEPIDEGPDDYDSADDGDWGDGDDED
jgi:hypothetical protein